MFVYTSSQRPLDGGARDRKGRKNIHGRNELDRSSAQIGAITQNNHTDNGTEVASSGEYLFWEAGHSRRCVLFLILLKNEGK